MTTVDRVLIEFVGKADSVVAAAGKADAAVGQVTAATKAAGVETANLGARSSTSFAQMGSAASKLGGTMSKYVSLPIAAVGVASIKMASDFQSAMLLINTQAGASTQEVQRMTAAVMQMAPAVGFGPKALADALYHIESVGIRGSSALDTLKFAAEGAKVGMASLEDTTNALAAIMVSGIKGVSGAGDAMGQLNAIVGAGNVRMGDLVASLGNLIPIAVSTGVSLSSLGAAFATLTDMGTPAADASTRLRMAIALMAGPSQQAAKDLNALGMGAADIQAHFASAPEALQKVGMSITTLSADLRKPDGIVVALTDLRNHLDATEKSLGLTGDAAKSFEAAFIKSAFGGAKMGTAITGLLEQLGRVKGKYEEITKATAGFGEAWRNTSETTRVAIDQALAALSTAAIEIGGDLAPTVKSAAKDLSGLAHWFSQLSPGVRHAVTDFALLAATVGPVLMIFGKLASSITAIKTLLSGLKGAQAASEIAAVGTAAEGSAAEVGVLGGAFAGLALPIIAVGAALAGVEWWVTRSVIPAIEKAHDVVARNTESMKNRFVTALGQMKGVSSTDMNSIVGDLNRLDAAGKLNDISMQNLQRDITLLGQLAAAHIPVTTAQMEALAGGGKDAAATVSHLKAELAAAAGIRVSGVTVSVSGLTNALGISHDKAVSVVAELAVMKAQHVDPGAMGIDTLMNSLGLTHDQAVALYNTLHSLDGMHVTSYATVVATLQQATSDASAITGAVTAPTGDVQGMAVGGDVFARTPYLIGEHGAELFMPNVDGTVVPHDKSMALINMLNRKRGVGTVVGSGATGSIRGSGHASPVIVNVKAEGHILTEHQLMDLIYSNLLARGFRNNGTGIRP